MTQSYQDVVQQLMDAARVAGITVQCAVVQQQVSAALAAGKALLEQSQRPLSDFVRASQDARAEMMDGVIDKAIDAQTRMLEQPVLAHKPYGYVDLNELSADEALRWVKTGKHTVPVYVALPVQPAVPLTDEQRMELVRIEHWRQGTMESGHWEKTKAMPRHIAERLLHHFDRASIITAAPKQGE